MSDSNKSENNQERLTRLKKNKAVKNRLLHLEHIEIRKILREKLTPEVWDQLPVRKQSAKIYGYRLSKLKKGRIEIKQLTTDLQSVYI